MSRVVIAAGGTGGHISPGIAIAEEISARQKELGIQELYFHVPERNRNYPDFAGFPWSIIWHNLPVFSRNLPVYFFRFLWTVLNTFRVLKRKKIDVVVAMGGYTSVPAILYAVFYRKKLFLCEQNVIPGKVNRYFQNKADKIALHLPVKKELLNNTSFKITGNPLRKSVATLKTKKKNFKKKKPGILVMGGSQGARQINNMVLNAFDKGDLYKKFNLTIITGVNLLEEVQNRAGDKKITLLPYTNRIGDFLADNEILVARSGAGVVAEAAVMGIPAIYIPYPFAADNHQKYNAEYFRENNACRVLENNSEEPDELLAVLSEFLENPGILAEMSEQQLKLAIRDSAKKTTDYFFGNKP